MLVLDLLMTTPHLETEPPRGEVTETAAEILAHQQVFGRIGAMVAHRLVRAPQRPQPDAAKPPAASLDVRIEHIPAFIADLEVDTPHDPRRDPARAILP